MTAKRTTHVAFVLDRSGSMSSCKKETIDGMNSHIDVVMKESDKDVRCSFVTFNQEVVTIFWESHVDHLQKLDEKNYVPDGGTAMLDAVGYTIERLKKEHPGDDHAFMVFVVSDGEENSSRKYTYNQVAELVKPLQETGRWTFVYLGSNQDLAEVRAATGFANAAVYTSSPIGTTGALRSSAGCMANYLRSASLGVSNANYWGTDEIKDLTEENDEDSLPGAQQKSATSPSK